MKTFTQFVEEKSQQEGFWGNAAAGVAAAVAPFMGSTATAADKPVDRASEVRPETQTKKLGSFNSGTTRLGVVNVQIDKRGGQEYLVFITAQPYQPKNSGNAKLDSEVRLRDMKYLEMKLFDFAKKNNRQVGANWEVKEVKGYMIAYGLLK